MSSATSLALIWLLGPPRKRQTETNHCQALEGENADHRSYAAVQTPVECTFQVGHADRTTASDMQSSCKTPPARLVCFPLSVTQTLTAWKKEIVGKQSHLWRNGSDTWEDPTQQP